jgi:predicted esterase
LYDAFVRKIALASMCAVLFIGPRPARAERDVPCAGCVLLAPQGDAPRPLLVLLHGDEGSPTKVVSAWQKAAEAAGVVLFAPRCPTALGCAGSYWRWDGDPGWVLDQVTAVERLHAIDPRRRYLAGWSGGTTYATLHVSSWFPTFAAASFAGGGVPAHDGRCVAHAGGGCAPIHYLAGDRNPLFDLAVGARQELEACGHDVVWDLHRGADHAGEWRAYEREVPALLAWLLDHREGCASAAPSPSTSSEPIPPAAPAEASTSTAPAPRAPTRAPPTVAPGCRCGLTPGRDAAPSGPRAGLALLLLCAARARQRGGLARARSSPRGPARTSSRRRASSSRPPRAA